MLHEYKHVLMPFWRLHSYTKTHLISNMMQLLPQPQKHWCNPPNSPQSPVKTPIMNMSTSTTSLTPHTVHCLKHSTKYQWNSTEWSAEMKGRECLVPHGETHVFSKILNSNTDRVALSAVFISKPLVFSTLSSVQVIITIAVDQTSSTAP